MSVNILGISAFYHDSAAALVVDGVIVSAAQEERFTRKKGDNSFPIYSIEYCLKQSGLTLEDIDYVVYYDNVEVKMSRLFSTQIRKAPRSFKQFCEVIPTWMRSKVNVSSQIKKSLRLLSPSTLESLPTILGCHHHRSHSAAAFFPSPYNQAAVLCIDGVGEWSTTSAWLGSGNNLKPIWEVKFPHSLGLLYSAFTYYIGFKVNFGEYKLMGLAPYGKPKFKEIILNNLIDVKDDGSFELNMRYFDFEVGNQMINKKFENLFGRPTKIPETSVTQFDMDIASSIQSVITDIIIKIAINLQRETGEQNLCLGGGVALNCVANGELLRRNVFRSIWVQPACGDAGSSLGAALSAWYEYLGQSRTVDLNDSMHGSLLGPSNTDDEIRNFLSERGAQFSELETPELIDRSASLLADGNVIGWFQGRMEFGPRALGNRSILGDPRCQDMQKKMNLKIKFRESFRPFAPAILSDHVEEYFEALKDSKYMLFVSPIKKSQRMEITPEQKNYEGIKKLSIVRSSVPAITHVDYSARVQTVHSDINPLFYNLIDSFRHLTGCPALINTSFNVRGEPIVCNHQDAFRCFMRTNMDYLVLGNIILDKKQQPEELLSEYQNLPQELD